MEPKETAISGVPPEVVFDRYFRSKLTSDEREEYRGKVDLDAIQNESTRLVLHDVQDSINNAYAAQRFRIAGQDLLHGVHFDYAQSSVTNALAFEDEAYAFVGFTVPI